MPCRYISGSTSATFGLLRHHGGRIALRNRARSPVTGSTRRSSTRGARTSIAPARRRDRARLGMPVADHQPPAPLVALVSQRRPRTRRPRPPAPRPASAGRPHGTISSRRRAELTAPRRRPLPSTSAFLPPRRCRAGSSSFGSTRKVRRAPNRWPIHNFRSYLSSGRRSRTDCLWVMSPAWNLFHSSAIREDEEPITRTKAPGLDRGLRFALLGGWPRVLHDQ